MSFPYTSHKKILANCPSHLNLQHSFSQLFKKTVILLSGPTGSGKTDVSLQLAPMVNGEIISVDSMQVYRGMDIGTAKISWEKRQLIPHYLIDICHVQETFNVVDFYYQAIHACQSILDRNKVPILVGGTGFYFHVFLSGPPEGPPADFAFRERLESCVQEQGVKSLYQVLQEKDFAYSQTITKNDKNKIIRALEIIHLTGKKVSEHAWSSQIDVPKDFHCRCWFLSPPKELLKDRIYSRCAYMLQAGLIQEVETLIQQGIQDNPTASKAIGYREWIQFLNIGSPQHMYESTKELFLKNSWRYTKKQRTWFKRYHLFQELATFGMTVKGIAERIANDYFLHC